MIVTPQYCGRKVVGLSIGASNAKRFIARRTGTIELELDHLRIECRLAPEFWQGEAEIHDSRLCAWLESKGHRSTPRNRHSMAMTRIGENCFRLDPPSQMHS